MRRKGQHRVRSSGNKPPEEVRAAVLRGLDAVAPAVPAELAALRADLEWIEGEIRAAKLRGEAVRELNTQRQVVLGEIRGLEAVIDERHPERVGR